MSQQRGSGAGVASSATSKVNGVDDIIAPARAQRKPPATTFCDRFRAELFDSPYAEGQSAESLREIGIPRQIAARILRPISYRFIPSVVCERRRFVRIGVLAMLCCCLDDQDVGASPECVTAQQLQLAWTAAGQINWLKRETLRALRHRADQQVLREHIDLVPAALVADFQS